jgi:hypothetical protein
MIKARRLLLTIGLVAFAASAHAQVSLPGSDWVGPARLKGKISVPGEGSDKVSGPTTYSLFFGPLAAQGLAANEFRAVLDDGSETLDFEGTYITDVRGNPVLQPDPVEFEAGLRDLIEDVCLSTVGDPVQCAVFDGLSLSISRSQFKQKARASKTGAQSIKSSGQIDFHFLNGGSIVVRVKLRFKSGSGGLQ